MGTLRYLGELRKDAPTKSASEVRYGRLAPLRETDLRISDPRREDQVVGHK